MPQTSAKHIFEPVLIKLHRSFQMGSKVIRVPTADVEDFFLLGIYIQWFMLLFKTLKTVRYICYLRSLHTPPNRLGFAMDWSAFQQFRQYQAHRIFFYNAVNLLKCIFITCIYKYRIIHMLWTFSGSLLREFNIKNNERNKSAILCVIISTAFTLYQFAKYAYINYALNDAYNFFSENIQSFIKNMVMHWFYKTLNLLVTTFAVFFGHRQFGLFFPFYAWGLILPFMSTLSLLSSYMTPAEKPENDWVLNSTKRFAGYFDINIEHIAISPFLRKPNRFMYSLKHLLNFGLFRCIKLDYNIVRKDSTISNDSIWKKLDGDHIMALLCHQLGQYYYNHSIKTLISWMSNMFFLVVSACHFFGYSLYLKERPLTVMFFYFILYVVDPYLNLTEPLQIATQLQFLREADKFVADNGFAQDFQEALVKMFHLEMEEDDEVSFYSFLYHPRVVLYEKTVTTYRILSCGI